MDSSIFMRLAFAIQQKKYHNIYATVSLSDKPIVGLEPTTYALRMRCSTN